VALIKDERIEKFLTESVALDDPTAEPARLYLKSRGLDPSFGSNALAFHPSLPYYDEENKKVGEFPTLIGRITDSQNNVIGLQRIYLTKDGKKANVASPKKVIGNVKGGGIYFDPLEEVINVAEGPETSLAIRLGTTRPTVSAISANGMQAIQIPALVKTVHIWADLDRSGAGERAMRELANRLLKEGRKVFSHIPTGPIPDGKKGIDWLDIFNERNLKEFYEEGEPVVEQKRVSKIKSLSLPEYMEEGRFPALVPIVEGILHQLELAILSATAKTGKSMLGANLAICVASGIDFLGKFKTTPTTVLLIQTEVSDGQFSERLRIMSSGLNIKDLPHNLHISSQRFALDEKEGVEDLRLKIIELGAKLIILDPFYTLHHKDEDKARDMAPLLSDLREMSLAVGATCLLIHHQGKIGEKSDRRQTGHQHRGSSSFADVPDGSWSLMKKNDEDNHATLSFELRNAKSPPTLRLKIDSYLWWKSEGEERKLNGEEEAEIIAGLILPGEKVSKKELQKRINEALGKKSRTADKLIKRATEYGKVYSIKDGREVKHFRPMPNGHSDQIPTDLETNGDATKAPNQLNLPETDGPPPEGLT